MLKKFSYVRTVRSSLPEMTNLSLGVNLTTFTSSSWPFKPISPEFQSCTVVALPVDTSIFFLLVAVVFEAYAMCTVEVRTIEKVVDQSQTPKSGLTYTRTFE